MLGTRQKVAPSTVVVLEKEGSFFAYEPNLGIVASDSTVDGAYRKFADAKRAFMQEAERAGVAIGQSVAPIPPMRPSRLPAAGQRGVLAELMMFFAKICIVSLVVGLIGAMIASGIGRQTASMKPLTMADIADKAADIARDTSSMSPEKKELFRQSVGTISRELGPVFDAWRSPPAR